jgi:hypothetical protein
MYTHTYICVYKHAYMYNYIYIISFLYTYGCTCYDHASSYIHIIQYACINTHAYIHTCTHACIHTHTHTQHTQHARTHTTHTHLRRWFFRTCETDKPTVRANPDATRQKTQPVSNTSTAPVSLSFRRVCCLLPMTCICCNWAP